MFSFPESRIRRMRGNWLTQVQLENGPGGRDELVVLPTYRRHACCLLVKRSCSTRRGFVDILPRYRSKICSCLRQSGGINRLKCCSTVTNSSSQSPVNNTSTHLAQVLRHHRQHPQIKCFPSVDFFFVTFRYHWDAKQDSTSTLIAFFNSKLKLPHMIYLQKMFLLLQPISFQSHVYLVLLLLPLLRSLLAHTALLRFCLSSFFDA